MINLFSKAKARKVVPVEDTTNEQVDARHVVKTASADGAFVDINQFAVPILGGPILGIDKPQQGPIGGGEPHIDASEEDAQAVLFTFLSENIDKLRTDGPTLRAFEQLTVDCCRRCDDKALVQLLKTHGWTGSRFQATPTLRLDANSFFLAFLNLHIRKTAAHGAAGGQDVSKAVTVTEAKAAEVSSTSLSKNIQTSVNTELPLLSKPPLIPSSAMGIGIERQDSGETVVSMPSVGSFKLYPEGKPPAQSQLENKYFSSSQSSFTSSNSKSNMLETMPSNYNITNFGTGTGTGDEAHEIQAEEDRAITGHVRSFCPNILLSHLSTRPVDDIMQVSCTSFEGACMLADISGFTMFSGAMCSMGLAGLDDLHTATNEFLGHFVDIVYQFRGDVVAFAGDALICVFRPIEEDDHQQQQQQTNNSNNNARSISHGASDPGAPNNQYPCKNYCLRALQCASKLKNYHSEKLSTHIAVSAGEIKFAVLGGHNSEWTYLLNGACISELASCIEDAGPRQVVATKACYELALAGIAADEVEEEERRKKNMMIIQLQNDEKEKAATAEDTSSGISDFVGGDNHAATTAAVLISVTSDKDRHSQGTTAAAAGDDAFPFPTNTLDTGTGTAMLGSSGQSDTSLPLPSSSSSSGGIANNNDTNSGIPQITHRARQSSTLLANLSETFNQLTSSTIAVPKSGSSDKLNKIAFMPKSGSSDHLPNMSTGILMNAAGYGSGKTTTAASSVRSNIITSFNSRGDGMLTTTAKGEQSEDAAAHGDGSYVDPATHHHHHIVRKIEVPVLPQHIVTAVECPKTGNYLIQQVANGGPGHYKFEKLHFPNLKQQRLALRSAEMRNCSPEVLEAAEFFVPRPALAAIYAQSLDSLSELRQVTTMFLRLDSYSPVGHENPLSLQPFFYLLQEVLDESGGFLRQFLVDDKGCVAIAMWGVPSFSYANNCSRGLYCAVTMSLRAASVSHRCSIGLTTGNVYCGNVGSSSREDYVGIGDMVNLAARFMAKAGGKVLVDSTTFHLLPRDGKKGLTFLDHELVLKGQALPIRPYYYTGNVPPSLTSGDDNVDQSIVLRKDLMTLLAARLDEVSESYVRNTATLTSKTKSYNKSESFGRLTSSKRNRSLQIRRSFEGRPQLLAPSAVTNASNTGGGGVFSLGVVAAGSESRQSSVHSIRTDGGSSSRNGSMSDFDPQVAVAAEEEVEELCVRFTVIVGMPGTGKSTATSYFREGAKKRHLNYIILHAKSGDESVHYGVIARLFWSMANPHGDDITDESGADLKIVEDIVHRAYAQSDEETRISALVSMFAILGMDEYTRRKQQLSTIDTPDGGSATATNSNSVQKDTVLQRRMSRRGSVLGLHGSDISSSPEIRMRKLSQHAFEESFRLHGSRRASAEFGGGGTGASGSSASHRRSFLLGSNMSSGGGGGERGTGKEKDDDDGDDDQEEVVVVVQSHRPFSLDGLTEKKGSGGSGQDITGGISSIQQQGKVPAAAAHKPGSTGSTDKMMVAINSALSSLSSAAQRRGSKEVDKEDAVKVKGVLSHSASGGSAGHFLTNLTGLGPRQGSKELKEAAAMETGGQSTGGGSVAVYSGLDGGGSSSGAGPHTMMKPPAAEGSKQDSAAHDPVGATAASISNDKGGLAPPGVPQVPPPPSSQSPFNGRRRSFVDTAMDILSPMIPSGILGKPSSTVAAALREEQLIRTYSAPAEEAAPQVLVRSDVSVKAHKQEQDDGQSTTDHDEAKDSCSHIQDAGAVKAVDEKSEQLPPVGQKPRRNSKDDRRNTGRRSSRDSDTAAIEEATGDEFMPLPSRRGSAGDVVTEGVVPGAYDGFDPGRRRSSLGVEQSEMEFGRQPSELPQIVGAGGPFSFAGQQKKGGGGGGGKGSGTMNKIRSAHSRSGSGSSNSDLPSPAGSGGKLTVNTKQLRAADVFDRIQRSDTANSVDAVVTDQLVFYRVMQCLLSQQRTVIIVEDAHFCDELSWRELSRWVRMPVRCTVLLTMRQSGGSSGGGGGGGGRRVFEDNALVGSGASNNVQSFLSTLNNSVASTYGLQLTDSNSDIMNHPNTKIHRMGELQEEEVQEILYTVLGRGNVPDDLIKQVNQVSSGNAFWCNTIAQFILENGAVEFARAMGRSGELQISLRFLVIGRLETFASEAQLVAKYAAIVGDEFAESTLVHILPVKTKAMLITSMEALAEHGFVQQTEELPEKVWCFLNSLIKETLYELTPPSDAMKVHLQIARLIEEKYAKNLRPHYASLSHHYKLSIGQRPLAFKYTVKAADQAISRGAFASGLNFAHTALTLVAEKREAKVLMDVADRGYFDVSVSQTIHDVEATKFSAISASFAADRSPERYQNGLKARYKQLREDAEIKYLNMESEAMMAAAAAAAKAAADASALLTMSPNGTRGSFLQLSAAVIGAVVTRLSFNIGTRHISSDDHQQQQNHQNSSNAHTHISPTATGTKPASIGSVTATATSPHGSLPLVKKPLVNPRVAALSGATTAHHVVNDALTPEGGESSPSPLVTKHQNNGGGVRGGVASSPKSNRSPHLSPHDSPGSSRGAKVIGSYTGLGTMDKNSNQPIDGVLGQHIADVATGIDDAVNSNPEQHTNTGINIYSMNVPSTQADNTSTNVAVGPQNNSNSVSTATAGGMNQAQSPHSMIGKFYSSESDSALFSPKERRKSRMLSHRFSVGVLNWEPSYVAQRLREGVTGISDHLSLSRKVDAPERRKAEAETHHGEGGEGGGRERGGGRGGGGCIIM